MHVDFSSMKPIYVQIAEAIEDDILLGKLEEGEAAYSQLVLSRELTVNPATAAKGLRLLVEKGLLEKQRGLSMTVAEGARERLTTEKQQGGFSQMAENLVREARKIGLPKEQVLSTIETLFETTDETQSTEGSERDD